MIEVSGVFFRAHRGRLQWWRPATEDRPSTEGWLTMGSYLCIVGPFRGELAVEDDRGLSLVRFDPTDIDATIECRLVYCP